MQPRLKPWKENTNSDLNIYVLHKIQNKKQRINEEHIENKRISVEDRKQYAKLCTKKK